jgi:hypothetical protein
VAAEQFAAFHGVWPALHVPQLSLFGRKPDRRNLEIGEEGSELSAGFSNESIGKEVAVSKNDAEGAGHERFLSELSNFLEVPVIIDIGSGDEIAGYDLFFGLAGCAGSEKLVGLLNSHARDDNRRLEGGAL